MVEPRRFQFSVANVLLVTFAVGWTLGGVTAAVRVPDSEVRTAAIVSVLLVLGISMAIGSIASGFRGMTRGFIVGTCVLAAIALVGWLLSVTWMVIRGSLGGAG